MTATPVTQYLDAALLERLAGLQLSAQRIVEGTTLGQHRSPFRGASVEFRQHRPYVPGDEPRRLDWRILARTDRPYVRQYEEETNLRGALLLDQSGSMTYAGGRRTRKFDFAAKVVASLAYLMLKRGESAGVATFGPGITQWVAPHAGVSQLSRVIDVLERMSPQGKADAARALHEAAERLGRRSLVVLVSDLFCDVAQLKAALARLQHARHEVILLRVLDPDEIEFPFRRWMRFHGLEGEAARVCEPGVIRERYRAAFESHSARLEELCRLTRTDFRTFNTAQPVDQQLVTFLRQRVGE